MVEAMEAARAVEVTAAAMVAVAGGGEGAVAMEAGRVAVVKVAAARAVEVTAAAMVAVDWEVARGAVAMEAGGWRWRWRRRGRWR